MLDEREKASVPCELAAAASARSANVKMAPPCVRAPALRCSGFISNLALLYPLRTSSSTTPVFSLDTHFEPWKKASDFSGRFHIYKGKNGNIWLGNNWGEIVIIDPLTNEVESFHLQNNKGERIQTVIYSL